MLVSGSRKTGERCLLIVPVDGGEKDETSPMRCRALASIDYSDPARFIDCLFTAFRNETTTLASDEIAVPVGDRPSENCASQSLPGKHPVVELDMRTGTRLSTPYISKEILFETAISS